MSRILIIEDDLEIAQLEQDYFEAYGLEAVIANDGLIGKQEALGGKYDLIVLDLMLPKQDGFTICREIRQQSDIPIIVVSARQTDIDKIRLFGLGADDYMTKPFSPGELVARVKVRLARYQQLCQAKQQDKKNSECLLCDELRAEPETHRVFLAGKEIILPNREFELLIFFMRHPGLVFSRDQLFEKIWGIDAMGDTATVAVHINRLREKIEKDSAKPHYIETIRGAGYRFCKR